MKKMFVIVAMFVAATMVACCGEQGKENKECCGEQKTECTGECDKAECKKECDKAECKGECKKECDKAECEKKAEAPAEAPAAPEAK